MVAPKLKKWEVVLLNQPMHLRLHVDLSPLMEGGDAPNDASFEGIVESAVSDLFVQAGWRGGENDERFSDFVSTLVVEDTAFDVPGLVQGTRGGYEHLRRFVGLCQRAGSFHELRKRQSADLVYHTCHAWTARNLQEIHHASLSADVMLYHLFGFYDSLEQAAYGISESDLADESVVLWDIAPWLAGNIDWGGVWSSYFQHRYWYDSRTGATFRNV